MIVRNLCHLILGMSFIAPLHADELVRVARYSTLEPVATHAQAEPLEVVVQLQFPQQITTVKGALVYLLSRSGYRLAEVKAADPQFTSLLRMPLPEVHRQLGPITLSRALKTLAGSAWQLVIDPVHRLVSFELAHRYRTTPFASGPSTDQCAERRLPKTPEDS